MPELMFERVISFDSLPSDWDLVRVAVDWAGNPLLLMAEGGGRRPEPPINPEAWSRWLQTSPTALHVVYLEGNSVRTTRIAEGIGRLTMHVQPYDSGWVLGYGRGGRANVYGTDGELLRTMKIGDAVEDLQTLSDGRIWVSYFDEGVYGSGISTQGLVCFDRAGKAIFKFREYADKPKLPPIDDCYAMNVTGHGDVWVNYYMAFPLVLLREMEASQHWLEFGSMGNAFAVRGDHVIYLRDSKLMTRRLEPMSEPENMDAVDASGNRLSPCATRYLSGAARGSSLVLNTGTAIYVAAP